MMNCTRNRHSFGEGLNEVRPRRPEQSVSYTKLSAIGQVSQ